MIKLVTFLGITVVSAMASMLAIVVGCLLFAVMGNLLPAMTSETVLGVYVVLFSIAAGFACGKLWQPEQAPWEQEQQQVSIALPCVFLGWSAAAVLYDLLATYFSGYPIDSLLHFWDIACVLGTAASTTLGVFLSRFRPARD